MNTDYKCLKIVHLLHILCYWWRNCDVR